MSLLEKKKKKHEKNEVVWAWHFPPRSPHFTVSKWLQNSPNFLTHTYFKHWVGHKIVPKTEIHFKVRKTIIKEKFLCLGIFGVRYATHPANIDVSYFRLCNLENVFVGIIWDNWKEPRLASSILFHRFS